MADKAAKLSATEEASKEKKSSINKTTPRKEVEIPDINEFLKAGVHFGHRTSRWHPKMKPYIYAEKDGVHIIDVVKTMDLLKVALKSIQEASDKGGVLIVGTKGQAANMVEKVAKEFGAFYINNRWPGGLFSNFEMIKKSVDKLIKMEEELSAGAEDLVKKEQLMLGREVERLNKLYDGIKFMDKLPQIVIVIDSKIEKGAIREADNVGIDTVALIDSNCDPDLVKYAVPANDDSIKSITLFLGLFAEAIKGGKRSDALIALRNSHSAKLLTMKAEYENKIELAKRMEEEERERMKRLRAGLEIEAKELAKPKKSDSNVVRVVEESHSESGDENSVKNVEDLDLATRSKNALLAAGYIKVSDIKKLAKSELTSIKGIGEKAAEEILKLIK